MLWSFSLVLLPGIATSSFPSSCGDCVCSEPCVCSSNYDSCGPNAAPSSSSYDDGETCSVDFGEKVVLTAHAFRTESDYDYVRLDGESTKYSGTSTNGLDGSTISSLVWTSDGSVQDICSGKISFRVLILGLD